MLIVVKSIAILMMACGTVYLVKPEIMRQVMRIIRKEHWLYIGTVVNLLVAIIFFLAAGKAAWPWFMILLGTIALIKGSLIFVLGPQKIVIKLEKLAEKKDKDLRIMALISLIIGVIIIYIT